MSDEIKPNPIREINDQWFNIEIPLQLACFERGYHRWGRDKYAGSDGAGGPDPTQGYHNCLDCYRCEPL